MSALDDKRIALTEALTAYDHEVLAALDVSATRIADLEAQVDALTPLPPRMRVGISVKDAAQFSQRTIDFGGSPEIARIFFPGLPGQIDVPPPVQTVVSFKPPNNDVAGFIAGKYDDQVSFWLTTYKGRLAVYHEREDNIARGEFSMAQALAMDDHMAELVSNYGPKARFGIILMGWTLDSRSGRTLSNYIPIPSLYDWVGWDSYPGDTPGLDLPDLSATRDWYTRCRDNSFGLPWLICETGTRNRSMDDEGYDQAQADWITGAVQIARDLGCRGWTYFDSTVGGDFTLKGPKAYAAMGTAIRA